MKAFWEWLTPSRVDDWVAQNIIDRMFEVACQQADEDGLLSETAGRMDFARDRIAWGTYFKMYRPDERRPVFPWVKCRPAAKEGAVESAEYKRWRLRNGKALHKAEDVSAPTTAMRELTIGSPED